MSYLDVLIIGPELILFIFCLTSLLIGSFYDSVKTSNFIFFTTIVILILLAIVIYISPYNTIPAFKGAFFRDAFAQYFQITILLSVAALLVLSKEYLIKCGLLKFEYPILIAFSTLGMLVVISSGNLLVLYLGIEVQSLSLYVIASFRRDNIRSTEAGLKYFVLGSLSSGLMLFGASLIYGSTGSIEFKEVLTAIDTDGFLLGITAGLVFLISGLAFKASAVPFHMWTPDVYEGSPTPVTGFFATAPKVAAIAILLRVLFDCFGSIVESWQQIIIFLSFCSMFLGSIAAIGQKNIKRLMAFSSIGHVGFALIGVAAATEEGVSAVLIYMVVYVIMNIGVFAFILNMERDGVAVTNIQSLSMYSQVSQGQTFLLSILLFSLAGIPPLVGFFGKFYIFSSAINSGLIWLAVLGGIASVIAAFYYLKIVYLMYFGAEKENLTGSMPFMHWFLLMSSALLMLVGTINLFGLEDPAKVAAISLLN
ncbi:MAG: NADH-quinone oxidoreductase subunit NuoN [Pseudomonadota bacterium]|nr:NADH-quinone oxidoreductase subunit NuoN [Pseudomonadota bacterium]